MEDSSPEPLQSKPKVERKNDISDFFNYLVDDSDTDSDQIEHPSS